MEFLLFLDFFGYERESLYGVYQRAILHCLTTDESTNQQGIETGVFCFLLHKCGDWEDSEELLLS